jgi:hypothetical protein
MVRSEHRGHKMELYNGKWVYSDNKQSVADFKRPCGYCGNDATKEGHDRCLGTLKGLMNACCGHSNIKKTFVQFLDGHIIRGEDARIIIDILKKELS